MDYNKKIQPDDFRYSLVIDGVIHVLKYSPRGWEESTVSNKRDLNYWAVLKSFSVPLEFVKDGALLIREAIYTKGTDYSIELIIERLNRSTWVYSTIFTAELDLSEVNDETSFIEVNLMEGGLPAKVSSYESVKYEIPFTEEDPVIKLGGVDLLEWFNIVSTSFSNTATGNMAYYFPATQAINYSIVLGGIALRDQRLLDGVNLYNFQTGDNCFFISEGFTGQLRLKGYFTVNAQQEANNGWEVKIRDSTTESGTLRLTLISTFSTQAEQIQSRRYEFEGNINIISGVKYFLTVESINPQNFSVCFLDILTSEIKAEYTQISDGTVIKGKRPKTLFKEILSKMNEEEVEVNSSLLEEWDNLIITSGDAIRGIENPLIKTSFKDFFKSMDSLLCSGFGFINNVPTIERKTFFFDNNKQVIDLGEVKNLKINPFTEIMNSSILVGYEKQDYEVERGREEFNNGQEYSTPIVRVQTKLNLISPYRADQYGMDDVRIKEYQRSANEKDTDNKSDNDVFMIHVYKEPVNEELIPIGTEYFEYITGVSERSNSYNYLLSPKRNLLRNLDFIKSMFYGSSNDNGFIRFTSADKNSDLETKAITESFSVLEKSDININDIQDRIFLPFEAEFETDYPFNFQDLLNEDPNGYITFNFMGNFFKAFIKEIEVDLSKNTSSVMKVILAKDNDLTKLIH